MRALERDDWQVPRNEAAGLWAMDDHLGHGYGLDIQVNVHGSVSGRVGEFEWSDMIDHGESFF